MAIDNNPAGRLHTILTRVRGSGEKVPGLRAWTEALLEEDDERLEIGSYVLEVEEFHRRMALVVSLIPAIEDALDRSGGVGLETYKKWLPQLRQRMLQPLAGNREWWLTNVTDAVMESLDGASAYLANSSAQATVEAEDLKSIRAAASKLLDDVLEASDLDPNLREVLARYCQRIVSAVDDYRIVGVEALRTVSEEIVGNTFFSERKVFQQAAKYGKRFGALFGKITILLYHLDGAENFIGDVSGAVKALQDSNP